jgi:3-hydroxybutyryl-CoA dehydrogenase
VSALSSKALVGVVGSGTMGAGIAQVAATAGHPVVLYDTRREAVPAAIETIRKNLQKLLSKNKISAEAAEKATAALRAAPDVNSLREAGIVIEAVAEDLCVKREVFAALEKIVSADCIFATNTSSISVSAIAAGLKKPQRLVGMHFFNPAPLMELVEVVAGLATDADVLVTAHDTAAKWGKTPVYAKSSPGFIVNRVARAFYGEGLLLLAEQAASPATLDSIVRESGCFRMGPFELMDLIGLDVGLAVSQSLFNAYFGDARYRPSFIQSEMVSAGRLGRKAGRGFYDYSGTAVDAAPATEAPQPKPSRVTLPAVGQFARALEMRLAGKAVSILRSDRHDADGIEVNGALLAVNDGRTAARLAHETGRPDCAVVDLALDYSTATRLAVARAQSCDEAAYRSVVGLLQAAGYAVSPMKDVAGMAVMRTVAMLANEAADAVNQGVASAPDIDIAMCKGLNYPRGPLAWAEQLGFATVARVLENLAFEYQSERYRVSPWIRQRIWCGESSKESVSETIAR